MFMVAGGPNVLEDGASLDFNLDWKALGRDLG